MRKLLLVVALCATSARAEFWDGNRLLAHIVSTSVVERSVGLGYVMGVHDTMQGVAHCTPPNVQAGQLRDMVGNYITNTPATRHYAADSLVLHVLKLGFPCRTKDTSSGNSKQI